MPAKQGTPYRSHRPLLLTLAAPAVALAFGAASTSAQLCDGLVTHWAFNGDATDSSGNGNNGQLFGGSFGQGVAGDAFQMGDGSFGPYAEFPNAPSLNPADAITVTAWWLATSFEGNGGNPIVDKPYINHSPPYYQYHLSVVGNQYPNHPASFEFAVGLNLQYVYALSNGAAWQPGRWYHLAGTYDGSAVRLYINGALSASTPATGQIIDYGRPVRVARFGNLNAGLPGAVDEVRIYNRALSAAEIAFLAASPAGNPLTSPSVQAACSAGAATFLATTAAAGPATYQWRRNGQTIDSTPSGNPSAATATLSLTGVSISDDGVYDCIVTGACGTATSTASRLLIDPSDLGQQGGLPGRDGLHDNNDFIAFINFFFDTDPIADLGSQGAALGSDGQFDNNDFIVFIDQFFTAC